MFRIHIFMLIRIQPKISVFGSGSRVPIECRFGSMTSLLQFGDIKYEYIDNFLLFLYRGPALHAFFRKDMENYVNLCTNLRARIRMMNTDTDLDPDDKFYVVPEPKHYKSRNIGNSN